MLCGPWDMARKRAVLSAMGSCRSIKGCSDLAYSVRRAAQLWVKMDKGEQGD